MAHPDLITKCTTCRETLVIARESAQMARPITCPHCGTPAMVWQLIGRSQREIEVDDYAPQFPQKPFADSPGWEAV